MSEQEKKPNKFKEYLLDIFFPRHIKCVFCDEELNANSHNDCCENCLQTLPYIKNYCERCGEPLSASNAGVCLMCSKNNFSFDLARSVFTYEGNVVKAIHRYKYHNQKFLSVPFAQFLCDYLARWDISPNLVCAVPLSKNKQKQRKFNQAKLLAEYVAKEFNIPYVEAVNKVKDNSTQTALSFKERQENVKGVYALNDNFKNEIANKSVLLIDDIYTTGATANEISKLLKSAHASAVYVLTLAHTVIIPDFDAKTTNKKLKLKKFKN